MGANELSAACDAAIAALAFHLAALGFGIIALTGLALWAALAVAGV